MTTVLAAASPGVDVPAVPGFIASTFNPLVYAVARQCLGPAHLDGDRTAIVLTSVLGDTTTADLHSRRLIAGQVHNPLLFMQATANAVLGCLAAEFAVGGPLISISPPTDGAAAALGLAELLLAGGEADTVLVVAVELAAGPRSAASGFPAPDRDAAVALLLGAGGPPLPATHQTGRGGVADLVHAAGGHLHTQGVS